MTFKIIDIQKDTNLNCYSVLTVVSINDFMDFIEPIHENKGNIREQREVLSTRSAKIIRNQMVEDLKEGGILPPIVIGSIHKSSIEENNFLNVVSLKKEENEIFILDGMQRIQALKDATNKKIISHNLRVEFWFAHDESALLYRMLVLNSGQIPWSLEKQLEVVFKPVLNELKPYIRNHSEDVWNDSDIVEMFLAFTSRKVRINKKQQLAEYHAALDVMSLIRHKSGKVVDRFSNIFVKMIEVNKLLIEIDNRYIFDNQVARIGFIVACSEKIFGLLGNEEEKDDFRVESNFEDVISKLGEIIRQINNKKDENKLGYFLSLDLLKETLSSLPKEKHRQAFLDGFKVLFSESEINTLAVCWKRMY